MAEGLFRHCVDEAGDDITVASAGISAMEGMPPSKNSVIAMKEDGIDISEQRSRMLTPPMVEEFTHIFGMTRGHIDVIRTYFPESLEKTFVLREFLSDGDLDLDVPDPIGMEMEEYIRCRNLIKESMPGILKFVVTGELDS
jgi:protein-tyrosine phosphatase